MVKKAENFLKIIKENNKTKKEDVKYLLTTMRKSLYGLYF